MKNTVKAMAKTRIKNRQPLHPDTSQITTSVVRRLSVLMFLGGLFFPINIMPDFLKTIANALPATNLNDAMRMIMLQGVAISEVGKELLIVGGWTIGCLMIAIKFFRWE